MKDKYLFEIFFIFFILFIGTWIFNWKEEKNLEWIGITTVICAIILLLPIHLMRYIDFIAFKKKSDQKSIGKITTESNFDTEDEISLLNKSFSFIIFEISYNLIETLKTIQIDKLSKKEDFTAFSGLGYCPNILLSAWIWIFWLTYDLLINDLLDLSDNGICFIIEKGLFQSILVIFIVTLTYIKSRPEMFNKTFINLLFIINLILFLIPLNYLKINDNYQIKDNNLIEFSQINELEKGSEQNINRIKFIAFQILRVFLFYVIFIIIEINYITRWKLNTLNKQMELPVTTNTTNNNLNKTEIQIKIIQTFWILFVSKIILIPCILVQLIILLFHYIKNIKLIKKYRDNFRNSVTEIIIEEEKIVSKKQKKRKKVVKVVKNLEDFEINDFFNTNIKLNS